MDYFMSFLVGLTVGILSTMLILEINQTNRYNGVGIETIKRCSINIETKDQSVHTNWYEIVWRNK